MVKKKKKSKYKFFPEIPKKTKTKALKKAKVLTSRQAGKILRARIARRKINEQRTNK